MVSNKQLKTKKKKVNALNRKQVTVTEPKKQKHSNNSEEPGSDFTNVQKKKHSKWKVKSKERKQNPVKKKYWKGKSQNDSEESEFEEVSGEIQKEVPNVNSLHSATGIGR